MGYFANGVEGLVYEETYCRRCIHGDGESAGECIVWFTHLLYAYEETDSGSNAELMLNALIPRDGVTNQQCTMFAERP